MDIQNSAMVLLGLAFALTGANLFRSSPPIGGFIIGGLLSINVAGMVFQAPPGLEIWFPVGAFIIGGLIGALLAIPLRGLISILSGIMLGIMIGAVVGYIASQGGVTKLIIQGVFNIGVISPLQALFMAGFGLIFGVLAIRFDEVMTAASTSYLGSLAAVSGIANLGKGMPVFENTIFMGFLWFTIGLLCWIWQSYHQEN
jgi:hypothetical protein